MTVFDRSVGQRAVPARVRRSGQDAQTVVEYVSVRHLRVRLSGPTVLRPTRLAEERSSPVAGTTQHSLGGHIWRVRELSVHDLHIPLRLHLAHCSLYHRTVTDYYSLCRSRRSQCG